MARVVAPAEERRLPDALVVTLSAASGVLGALVLLVAWSALASAEQPLLWWLGRALGFLAYVALWLSMLFGTLVSAGRRGGLISKKWTMDLHQEWTLAAVIATVLHVVVLVSHAETGASAWAAVIPFASERLTGSVALGTISGLMLAVIAVSSWARSRVPYSAWRALHALAFGAMVLAIAHSVAAGTDTPTAWARVLYLATAGSLGLVTALRVVLAVRVSSGARAG